MNEDLKTKILRWLSEGEVGLSSKAMAFTSLGMKANYDHPLDPSDFNRCLKLVKYIPEIKNHFPDISKLSKEWKAVIDNWDKIEKSFIDEVGFDWCKAISAPKTYELMKNLGL